MKKSDDIGLNANSFNTRWINVNSFFCRGPASPIRLIGQLFIKIIVGAFFMFLVNAFGTSGFTHSNQFYNFKRFRYFGYPRFSRSSYYQNNDCRLNK